MNIDRECKQQFQPVVDHVKQTFNSVKASCASTLSGETEILWSLVLKIIQSSSLEKNNPQHHNYWKREAFIQQSEILVYLPDGIHTPICYLVEEKPDGTVWIWMEEVNEDDRSWLDSWIKGCKQYASDPNLHYPLIHGNLEIDSIWNSYTFLNGNIEKLLHALSELPRVLAHQDLSRQNMYNYMNEGDKKLTLIDWQFLSISGIGEDLGKLFGVAMSHGDIPSEQGEYYQDLLFTSYLEGLREAGWIREVEFPKYGFYVSFALRSVWEVPKLFKLPANFQMNEQHQPRDPIEKLTRIVRLQMKLGEESDRILHKLLMGKAI